MRRLLGLCGLLAWSVAAVAADSPESLVQKLGSPRFAERDAASKELLKLGAAAIPAVRAAAETSTDPEVRERAAALLDPLTRSSESGKLLAVKPVKLEAKSVPLASAIADFKTKTGIPLMLAPGKVADTSRIVKIPAGEFAPWEALEIFLKATGLREDHRAELPSNGKEQQSMNRYYRSWDFDGSNQPIYTPTTAPILLADGTPDNLPAHRIGGVRVVALPPDFPANRVIRGAGRVIFHLDAAPLPSTGWHSANGVRITSAEDEDGRPVFSDLKLLHDALAGNNPYGWNPWGGWAMRRVFWGGGMFIDEGFGGGASPYANPRLVPVALRTNDRAFKKLKHFEGVLCGEVHTANVPIISVESLEKAVGTTYSGPQQSTLQVQEFKKHDNGTWTLRIRHDSLTQWALAQMRGGGNMFWNGSENPGDILNKIRYYDAAGKPLSPTQENTAYTGDGFRQSVDVTLRFAKTSAAPARLVVTGTRVTNVEVPFKLTNVLVP